MNLDTTLYTNKQVLFKHNGAWCAGKLLAAHLTESDLVFSIMDTSNMMHEADINHLYLYARKIAPYEQAYLISKDSFIPMIDELELTNGDCEDGAMSDGEYIYYPLAKMNSNWLEKQPFEYVFWTGRTM